MYDPSKPYKHEILKLIKKTWVNPNISVKEGIYNTFQKKFSGYEVDHTDGIGTKGYYHWQKRTFASAVTDALAMNLNDLALVDAVPYKLQNHITLPIDDKDAILEIMNCLSDECIKRKIAITGGETSIHEGENFMDISMTVSGIVTKTIKNKCQIGDILIGLPSNGIHSNGFTKVREVFGKEIRDEFARPTEIYLDKILKLLEKVDVHAMMHITGGAYTKLKDLLGEEDIIIEKNHPLIPQKIFYELYEKGIDDKEMYRTFNCSIGFIISVNKKDVAQTKKITGGEVIGEVVKGNQKINIPSFFSKNTVVL